MANLKMDFDLPKIVEISDLLEGGKGFFVPSRSKTCGSDEMTSAFGILTAPLKHRKQKIFYSKNWIESEKNSSHISLE